LARIGIQATQACAHASIWRCRSNDRQARFFSSVAQTSGSTSVPRWSDEHDVTARIDLRQQRHCHAQSASPLAGPPASTNTGSGALFLASAARPQTGSQGAAGGGVRRLRDLDLSAADLL